MSVAKTKALSATPAGASEPRPWQVASDRVAGVTRGLDWLSHRRTTALARIEASGLPTTDHEDWRHTSLASYRERWAGYLTMAPDSGAVQKPALPLPGISASYVVNIIDGVVSAPPAGGQPGLMVCSLRHPTPELRQRAEGLLDQTDLWPTDSLQDLNMALLTDAILITTDPGSCPTRPVHIRLQAGAIPALSQPRILVDLGPDSRLTLILEHSGTSGALVNAVSCLWLGRGSQLEFVRVQILPDDAMLTETTCISLGESAGVTATSVDLGGRLSRQALTILLAGAGSSANVHGMFLADGTRHIDNRTRLEHQAPRTTSRENFRGIADGRGHGIFNGKIVVLPGAAGSNAALTNRNLLLAATAEIDTKPELEIYVDDVRCSHGATIGQLDMNALFYLRSRGLDPVAARQVLTAAFLREGLSGLAVPELRTRLEAQLQARLGGDLGIEGTT